MHAAGQRVDIPGSVGRELRDRLRVLMLRADAERSRHYNAVGFALAENQYHRDIRELAAKTALKYSPAVLPPDAKYLWELNGDAVVALVVQ